MQASEPVARAAFLTDAAGTVLTWSDASERMFQCEAGAIVGQPIASLLAGEARQECLRRWPRLPHDTEALRVRIARPDGSTAYALLTLVPQHDAHRHGGNWVALFSTLTERVLSESDIVGQIPLASVVDVLAGTFYVLNRDGGFVLWNRRLEQVAEMDARELARANALDMFDQAERAVVADRIRRVFEHDEEVLIEANYRSKTGKRTPFLMCGTRIAWRGVHYLCGMGLDTSRSHAQQAQLRLRERALHAASNGIVIARCEDGDNPIEYVNTAFERITGYSAAEALGRDSRFMAAPGLDEDERNALREAIRARRDARVVFRNQRKDGAIFWNDLAITPVQDESGRVTHFIGVLTDVTAARQRTADLEHEVNHDALTGLANRNLMWDRLEQAIHFAQRNKTMVAAVMVDLDGFKQINDTFSHEAGDAVLTAFARRLQAAVRDSDTVARLSGDEFVLILANQPSLRFTSRMLERLRVNMSAPVPFERADIPVAASMGVAVFPHDGSSAFELVRAADAAMYHAKACGKHDIHFYSDDMRATSEAKLQLEDHMRSALERDELFMLYQPRFCTRSGRIVGIEALLRWRHPEQGVLLPASFLPEAEDNGLIVPIGKRVLYQACMLLRELRARGMPNLVVSINTSFREFSQEHFVSHVAQRLRQFALAPDCLELELKEDHLLRNLPLSSVVAAEMNSLGLRLAVDDFGAGMTCLPYLHTHHVAHVKMHRDALHTVGNGAGDGELAKTLIDIGHNLHIGVVAQGVETLTQLNFLKANGCDEIQGRYISDPLTGDALQRLLSSAQTI